MKQDLLNILKRELLKMDYRTEEKGEEVSIYHKDRYLLSFSDIGFTMEHRGEEQEMVMGSLRKLQEAYKMYEKGQPLTFDSITDYRVVANFNDVILAVKLNRYNELNFTTWDYDFNHKGVNQGHYFDTNYDGAKQDFAIRAGLIDKSKLFEKQELAAIYDACVYRGVNDGEITYDDEKLLREVMDKVEENLPETVKQEHEVENDMER